MHRTLGIGDRETPSLSLARLGAALVAVLVGEAAGQAPLTTTDNGPTGAAYSFAASYSPPTTPGGTIRLRVDAPPSAQAMVIVTRGPEAATAEDPLSFEEWASAVVVPVALDAQGDLDLFAAAPAEIPIELLRQSRLRFRVTFLIPGISDPLISDPIAVVPQEASTVDPNPAPPLTASPTTDSSATTTSVASTSFAAISTTSSAATSSGAASSSTSASTTAATSSVASSVASSSVENETDSASAPPSATKAGASPTQSVSVPLPSNQQVRFVTLFTLVSATHDQPSPIQGSGH